MAQGMTDARAMGPIARWAGSGLQGLREHDENAARAAQVGQLVDVAAGLLTMTSLSVTQVAHRTGFVDGRHLSRHFARRYGVTPGRYRRAPVAPPAGRP